MHGKVPLKEDLIETDEDGYLPEEFFLTPLEHFNESKFIFDELKLPPPSVLGLTPATLRQETNEELIDIDYLITKKLLSDFLFHFYTYRIPEEKKQKYKFLISQDNSIFHSLVFSASKLENESECSSRWKIVSRIGAGKYGKIFKACCDDNCEYIVKIVTTKQYIGYQHSIQYGMNNEISIWKQVEKIGLAPRLVESYFHEGNLPSGDYWILVSTVMDITLEDALYQTYGHKDDRIHLELRKHIFSTVSKMLYDLHENGIVHMDCHFNNIMLKFKMGVGHYLTPDLLFNYLVYGECELKFIDFGMSSTKHLLETEIDLEKSRMEDRDMESILIELGCVNEEKKFDELTSDELFKILCYYDFDFVIRESEKYSDKELLKRIVRKYQERLDVCIP